MPAIIETLILGEVEVGGLEVQGHLWLHSEFQASLGYWDLVSNKTKQNQKPRELERWLGS